MKFRPLSLSVFAASAVFWLVSATAPISNVAHAAGIAKALKLSAPEDLSAPRSASCKAELAALVKLVDGDKEELRYRFATSDIYCIPISQADARRLEVELPGVMKRGPSAWGFTRSQTPDGISMGIILNVVPRVSIVAMIVKKRGVLVLHYDQVDL